MIFGQMLREKCVVVLLVVFIILNSLHVISLVSLSLSTHSDNAKTVKEDEKTPPTPPPGGGTYKTKEEVEKAPPGDHPCNLTRTTVKIQFPELRGELFVNLLGYKEPNLVHLTRCRGTCGSASHSECVPTQVEERSVNMGMRSHLQGQESKQRYKEITLEEHKQCGCRCKDTTDELCAGLFNTKTCACECEGNLMKTRISACTVRAAAYYWDYGTCQCTLRKPTQDCIAAFDEARAALGYRTVNILCYTLLGSCLTLAVFLASTTWQYRRRLQMARLQDMKSQKNVTRIHGLNLEHVLEESVIITTNSKSSQDTCDP